MDLLALIAFIFALFEGDMKKKQNYILYAILFTLCQILYKIK